MLELLKIYAIDEKLLKCVLGGTGEDESYYARQNNSDYTINEDELLDFL